MKKQSSYTETIRRLSFDHPLLSAAIVQITFWTISYLVFALLIYFTSNAANSAYGSSAPNYLTPLVLTALVMGLVYGSVLGVIDFYLGRKWAEGKSLGRLIFLKTLVYFIAVLVIFTCVRFVLWQGLLLPLYFEKGETLSDEAWAYYSVAVAIFTLFMSAFVSFFIQINKKFGPGVLLPFILGKYVRPQIEERVFIFLDLKSSTTHAENLGHMRYSEMIRDCFQDINIVSTRYNAQIYQYVGDEVVLSWPLNKNLDVAECFHFYFHCKRVFEKKAGYYADKYNLVPEFKAGMHSGTVTCVEVGEVKREIAYHGDALNVTARILAKCNEHDADIIFTAPVQERFYSIQYQYEKIGNVILKGKKQPVMIYKIAAH